VSENSKKTNCNITKVVIAISLHRSMVLLAVARAYTSVCAIPETFLLLQQVKGKRELVTSNETGL
jgi:hypothetical protein